jgi:tetratricopeptide (TPR) repeat protein
LLLARPGSATGSRAHPGAASGDPLDVRHVEQPTGIAADTYLNAWQELGPPLARLARGDTLGARSELEGVMASGHGSAGQRNLLAQLDREAGRLDQAERLIRQAIAAEPREALHHFQRAMICFARLRDSTGPFSKWRWHVKTRDAYRHAFDLDPRAVSYRYYLAYSCLQEPALLGGDKDRALALAQEGIGLGLEEFYVVRADCHRLRGEAGPALADYDTAIRLRIYKHRSFLAAVRLALARHDGARARRYADWGVLCQPKSPDVHEALGDYYVAVRDSAPASNAYARAIELNPSDQALRAKREKLQPR